MLRRGGARRQAAAPAGLSVGARLALLVLPAMAAGVLGSGAGGEAAAVLARLTPSQILRALRDVGYARAEMGERGAAGGAARRGEQDGGALLP